MTIIKICGLTNYEDARFALQAGADMLGFIFYEPSPRYVSPERVREIVSMLRTMEIRVQNSKFKIQNLKPETRNQKLETLFVGVFVNHSPKVVQQTLDFCGLDLAQLHGDESPQFLEELNGRAYKAINPRSFESAEAIIQSFAVHRSPFTIHHLPFILLDAFHPILRGGTGRVADWSMAAEIACQHNVLLAGGLSPENVASAIRQVKPWGVDVSSGVEAKKGKKDSAKVKAFIKAAKAESGE